MHELAPSWALYSSSQEPGILRTSRKAPLCSGSWSAHHPSAHLLIQAMNTPELQSAPSSDLQHFPNTSILMLHPSSLGKPLEDRIFVVRENIRRKTSALTKKKKKQTMEYKRIWRTGKETESNQHETKCPIKICGEEKRLLSEKKLADRFPRG